jgi:hypothetical protein
MQRETVIWTFVMLAGGLFLLVRGATVGNGRVYVQEVTVQSAGSDVTLTNYNEVPPSQRNDPGVLLSLPRTIGIWIAALCTLGIMSFVLGDNPLYKLAESVFVGVSAAYLMVAGFWNEIVANLFAKLFPQLMKDTLLPGLTELDRNWSYLVPLVLSVMMLWRLAPKGSWIARWPLAFFIGATAGIRLISYLEADFVQQINNTILPLVVFTAEGRFDIWGSIRNGLIVGGVLLGLVYFFFSVPHKGIVGGLARGGVWLLMITFGASFGYTVMGRIALLADRLEFLFDDWLWLIDPASQRIGM